MRQILVKRAVKAGLKGTLAEPFSPHGLRARFVTTAYGNAVTDEEIMGRTRHRSLTTRRSYVRRAKLSRESPVGKWGL
jgi:integrase